MPIKKILPALNFLKETHPPYIVLMMLLPQLATIFINYDAFDSRETIILLVWLPIIVSPYLLSKNKIVFKISVFVCFLESFIGFIHLLIIKGPLSITSLFVMLNTNLEESVDFIDLKFSYLWLLVFPYFYVVYLAFKTTPELKTDNNKRYVLLVVYLFCFIFLLENLVNGRFIRKAIPQTAETFTSFVYEMKTYSSLNNRVVKKVDAISTDKTKAQTFVLIIGESCNRNHMSLYGYARKTSPKLQERNDLIVFKDAVSPYSNTISSVLSILTESNLENTKPFDNCISLLDIFHSAGFKTYWLSNQTPIGVWDNSVTNLAKTSDQVKFVNISSNSSFEATSSISYDEKLFLPFENALQEPETKKLIVLHLMGSHSSYEKRYPAKFDSFDTEQSSTKQQTIDQYDNSILYNDYLVDSLFTLLSDHEKTQPNTYFASVYLSDHGENVYDEFDNAGHDYTISIPKSNVEVPFIVFLSANFKKMNTAKYKTIKQNSSLPFVTDDLFHSIIDLSSIQTPYLEKSRSVFHSTFNSKRVRTLEDKLDYDKK